MLLITVQVIWEMLEREVEDGLRDEPYPQDIQALYEKLGWFAENVQRLQERVGGEHKVNKGG